MNHIKSDNLPESNDALPEKQRMYFFRVYNIKGECIIEFKGINDEDIRSLSMFFDKFIMRKLRINGVQVACYTTGTDSVESELNKHAWLFSILCEKVETLLGAESILGTKNIDEYLSEVQVDTHILELALKSTEVSSNEQMLRIISDKIEFCEEKLAELVFGPQWKQYYHDPYKCFSKTRIEIRILELALKTAVELEDVHIITTISDKLKAHQKKLQRMFVEMYNTSQANNGSKITALQKCFSLLNDKGIVALVDSILAHGGNKLWDHIRNPEYYDAEYEGKTNNFKNYFRVYNADKECVIEIEDIDMKEAESLSPVFDNFIKRKLHVNDTPIESYTVEIDCKTDFFTHACLVTCLNKQVGSLQNATDVEYGEYFFNEETRLEVSIFGLALKSKEVLVEPELLFYISNRLFNYGEDFDYYHHGDYYRSPDKHYEKKQVEIRILKLAQELTDDTDVIFAISSKIAEHLIELRSLSINRCDTCQRNLSDADHVAALSYAEGDLEAVADFYSQLYELGCPHSGFKKYYCHIVQTLVRINPNDTETYFRRGVLRYHLGQFEDAIADYDDALRIEPNNRIYFNRGMAKYALNMISEARQDVQIALELANQAKDLDSKTSIEQFLRDYPRPMVN